MNGISAKTLRMIHGAVKIIIQLLFFLLMPSAFTAAFNGVKYIFTQIGNGEQIALTSFVTVLLVLCAYTIVFGRFFCGFACAFGTLGDAVHWIYMRVRKTLKKRNINLPGGLPYAWRKRLSYVKYIVLAAIVIMCFAGAYSVTAGWSPWDAFSMILSGNLRLPDYMPGLIILILIVIGMAVQERFFCRFLCPMGAVFSLMPVLPVFSLRRKRENCLNGCSACTRRCPSDIELPEDGSAEVCGDCFQCQKCIDTCPKENISCAVGVWRGNEVILTVIRAVLLLGLFLLTGL